MGNTPRVLMGLGRRFKGRKRLRFQRPACKKQQGRPENEFIFSV
jgi:hypothetical protein